MANYKEHFAGAFFKAEDVKTPIKAAIDRAELMTMNDGKEKPVVYLTGHRRGIVLNGTRYDQIVEITKTHETDDWVGHEVCVYADKTNFGGKKVACIAICSAKNEKARRVTPADIGGDDLPDNMRAEEEAF